MTNANAARAANDSMCDLALEYATKRNWPVFPCNPADKKPLTANGFKAASINPGQIRAWWQQHPNAMIGVPTGKASGFWVLDIDVKPKKDGSASLARLESVNGALPPTLSGATPSQGVHYYFKHDDVVRNSGSKLGIGIDVRGEGGYVIAPGSVRDDGCYYEWHSETSEIAIAPTWLVALIAKPVAAMPKIANNQPQSQVNNPAYSIAAIANELQKLMGTSTNRNIQLNESAHAIGQFVGAGAISASEAEDRLYGAAVASGYVGKDGEAAARATIKSGLEAGQAKPRDIPVATTDGYLPPAPKEWVAANDNVKHSKNLLPKMHPSPFKPESAGGLLGSLTDWITSTAIIPVPELSLAASVALIGGMFGARALGPTRSGVNLFMTTVMGVASGKGHAPKAIIKLANLAATSGSVTNGDPTSYAAIERMLRKNRSTAIVMDEFGITLQDVNGRHNPIASSIRKFLLAIYDQADSTFHGRQYASEGTKLDNEPIQGPALTVLGMTTAHTLYKGLSEDSLSEGFISRFVFVEGTHPAVIKAPKLTRVESIPTHLISELKKAIAEFPRSAGNLEGAFTKHTVPFHDGESGDAYARWTQVFDWQHWNGWNQRQRDVNGRAAENTVRLATIRAISRCQSNPAVTTEDVEWGWAIVHRSIQVVTNGADRHMSGSVPEALRKAILEALRNAKGHSLPWSQILQRDGMNKAVLKDVSEAIAWLIQVGDITTTHEGVKPGPRQSFTLKN
jgi:hypothetical protein